jgi:hypothetical protein
MKYQINILIPLAILLGASSANPAPAFALGSVTPIERDLGLADGLAPHSCQSSISYHRSCILS